MLGWLQQLGKRPVPAPTRQPIDTAEEKRKLEVRDMQLGIAERELKIGAIRRVVEGEPDPVTALEVVTVATHRGKLPPQIAPRRPSQQSPLETMAMAMLEKRINEDPMEALERTLERRERLEEAAERLSGGGRRPEAEPDSGNTFVDVARALANSPLGEAIGGVLGSQAQQRMAMAAAATGHPAPVDVAAPAAASQGDTAAAGFAPSQSPASLAGPRPASFRVSMAIRTLRGMAPAAGARWILGMAESNAQLSELIGPFVAADAEAVPVVLEAFMAEAAADPQVAEWLPLVAHLRESIEWTLACHQALHALMFVDDDGDEGETDPDLVVGTAAAS